MHALSFALLSAITPRAFPLGKRGVRAAIQRIASPQLRVAQRYYDAQNRPAIVQFNGTKYAYIHNLQGDIVGIIDSTGTEVVKYIYDPWGKILSTTGSLASTLGTVQPFRYRGYVYDVETGFYYLRARYYNPVTGRFMSGDRVLHGNAYEYCNNNWIIFHDINGYDGTLAIYIITLERDTYDGIPDGSSGHAWIVYTPTNGSPVAYGMWGDIISNVLGVIAQLVRALR